MCVDLEIITVISRLLMFSMILIMFIISAWSPLFGRGHWWSLWIAYSLTMIIGDLVQFLGLIGLLPTAFQGGLAWSLSGLARTLFVSGFLAFAGRRIIRAPAFWLSLGIMLLDLGANHTACFPGERDNIGQATNYLSAGLYFYVIVLAMRKTPCRLRWLGVLSGFAFATSLVPWSLLRAYGVLDQVQASAGAQIWHGMAVAAILLSFEINAIAAIAKEKDEAQAKAQNALYLAAIYVERDQNVRFNNADGLRLGRTESYSPM